MGINVNDLANEFEFEGNTFIEGVFQLVNTMRSAQGDEIVIESYYITGKNTGRTFVGIERIRNAQGDLAIPAEISGCAVMSIGEEAFEWCKNLTSLTIPATVTRIALGALRDCKRLKAFSVADDNPKFKSVSGLLLTKDGKTLVRGVNGDVTIPDGVTCIGDSAFSGLSGLTSVTIPDSVKIIGDAAFVWCDGLASMTIPSGVTAIGAAAFAHCCGLLDKKGFFVVRDVLYSYCGGEENVVIPDNVKVIGAGAFMCMGWGGDGFTNVTIRNGVIEIGEEAFFCCCKLMSVTIPNSVTRIGEHAFLYTALKSVYVSDGDANRVKKLFLDSKHDIKGVNFIESKNRWFVKTS